MVLQNVKSPLSPSRPAVDRRLGPHGEWLVREGNVVTIGLTRETVDQLGPVVHVEFPTLGSLMPRGSVGVTIESSKAAIDCEAPLSGKVATVNGSLYSNPEVLNESPEGAGWLYRLEDIDEQAWEALPLQPSFCS